jgi:predicted NBD/HSP70 family sugar kinase
MKEGTNLEGLNEMNRSLILKTIKKMKVCSRAEIAKITGLTQASITKIVTRLIESNIIKETGIIENKLGRRSIGISLNGEEYKVIGVKLARSEISSGLFDIEGNVYDIAKEKIGVKSSPRIAIDVIKKHIHSYLEKDNTVKAIGIAVPGPYLSHEGIIAKLTEFTGWEEVNLINEFKSEFEEKYDVSVHIEHDANSGVMYDLWFEDCELEKETMVHMIVSEGVGAGILVNDSLMIGYLGTAGEIGHVSIDINGRQCECGNKGCLEKYCSSIAFVNDTKKALLLYKESSLNKYEDLTSDNIFDEMENSDELAIKMVKEVSTYIGYGIVNLINLYSPKNIVISDYMSRGGDLLLETIDSVIKERVIQKLYESVSIKISDSSRDAILYGSAAVAIDKILTLPNRYME